MYSVYFGFKYCKSSQMFLKYNSNCIGCSKSRFLNFIIILPQILRPCNNYTGLQEKTKFFLRWILMYFLYYFFYISSTFELNLTIHQLPDSARTSNVLWSSLWYCILCDAGSSDYEGCHQFLDISTRMSSPEFSSWQEKLPFDFQKVKVNNKNLLHKRKVSAIHV